MPKLFPLIAVSFNRVASFFRNILLKTNKNLSQVLLEVLKTTAAAEETLSLHMQSLAASSGSTRPSEQWTDKQHKHWSFWSHIQCSATCLSFYPGLSKCHSCACYSIQFQLCVYSVDTETWTGIRYISKQPFSVTQMLQAACSNNELLVTPTIGWWMLLSLSHVHKQMKPLHGWSHGITVSIPI